MGVSRAEQSADIDASPEDCFAAIVDYETFPRWQTAVESIEVRERHPDGLGSVVAVEVDAKLRRVAYVLRYGYERPGRVWWEFVSGVGVDLIEGEFTFEPLDGGSRTRATYRLGIDPGVRVPALVAKRLTRGVMGRSVSDLAEEVGRRTAG